MNHRPYLVSLNVQNLIPNIQNLIYPSTLPNVACRKLIIPPIFASLTGNVVEQNSMYPHVGPYTPYFGSSYQGIASVPIMWYPMSNLLTNPMAPSKPISGIAQAGIVTNRKEFLDEDEDNSKRKHNSKMP
jgi:hypothetical protein